MNTAIIKSLGERFEESTGHITIGDADKCRQLEYIKDDNKQLHKDYPLENMLISIYNLLNTHKVRIDGLEADLKTLASRVYDSTENFTDEEIEEIKSVLDAMDLEDLENVVKDCDYLSDNLYCTEDDIDTQIKKADALMNKIKYPTKSMYDNFNLLLNSAIHFIKSTGFKQADFFDNEGNITELGKKESDKLLKEIPYIKSLK